MIRINKKLFILLSLLIIITAFFFYGAYIYELSSSVPTGDSLLKPDAIHLLGTDDLGIDIYAQISIGFFKSMKIGLISASLALIIGGLAGISAGLNKKSVDYVVSFLINLFLSVPQLPIMVVLGAFFGQNQNNIIINVY